MPAQRTAANQAGPHAASSRTSACVPHYRAGFAEGKGKHEPGRALRGYARQRVEYLLSHANGLRQCGLGLGDVAGCECSIYTRPEEYAFSERTEEKRN